MVHQAYQTYHGVPISTLPKNAKEHADMIHNLASFAVWGHSAEAKSPWSQKSQHSKWQLHEIKYEESQKKRKVQDQFKLQRTLPKQTMPFLRKRVFENISWTLAYK